MGARHPFDTFLFRTPVVVVGKAGKVRFSLSDPFVVVPVDETVTYAFWGHRVTSSVAAEPPTWRGLVTVIGPRPSGRLDEGLAVRQHHNYDRVTP